MGLGRIIFFPISRLETVNLTFLHIHIFSFLYGGLLRGPESGLEMAYFEQYMDSIRLIIHFNKGSAQGSRIWAWDGLFCPISGL